MQKRDGGPKKTWKVPLMEPTTEKGFVARHVRRKETHGFPTHPTSNKGVTRGD